jgi:hypothetical protein
MKIETDGREPLDVVAEEFLERYRRGERPALSEFAARHPELAEQIHELLPTLVEIEQVGCAPSVPPVHAAGFQCPEALGDYRIFREVGRGGMGIVFEAEQVSLRRRVALKVFPFHALLDPKHLARFQREARAAAQLHHSHIVPVFGVGHCEALTSVLDTSGKPSGDGFISKLVRSTSAASTAAATDEALMLVLTDDLTPRGKRK